MKQKRPKGTRLSAILVLALAVFLAAPLAVSAQETLYETLYVKADGDNGNDGLSEATAFKTLNFAVFHAWLHDFNTITVIGTLNQASENRDDEDDVFYVNVLGSMDEPILITGIPNAPAGRRAVLSAAGTTKNSVYTGRGSFRFEHIEISGSSKTGLRIGTNSNIVLGSGSLVRNNSGGGVFVYSPKDEYRDTYESGSLTLDGGIVENNKGVAGGGIYVAGTFTMKRGSVRNNTALPDKDGYSYGGGIFIYSSDPVSLEGGDISGNTASGSKGGGGGVGIESGRVTMSGGSIANNSATLVGGGVVVVSRAAFIQSGGSITGNRAPNYPNVFAADGARVSLLPAPSTPRPSSTSSPSITSSPSSGSAGSGGSLSAGNEQPPSRPAPAPARRSWFHDSDAGAYYAGSFGFDVRILSASVLAAGVPLQMGVGFNFLRMRLAILGEGEIGVGLRNYDDNLCIYLEASAGGTAEFYFPGRLIGVAAGWHIFRDKRLSGDADYDQDDLQTSFQRLGLIFQAPGAFKTTLYAQRFNDGTLGFGVTVGGAWGLKR